MEFGKWKASDIVSMRKYRKAMAYNPLPEVEAYWEALRGTRSVPLRSEIDPRGIERALDYTFLLERIAPGLARFRLAGSQLNDLIGMEVRGMPITACFAPNCRDKMRESLNLLFEGPQVVKLSLESKGGVGKPHLCGNMVLLPLQSDLGDTSRAIGCLQVDGKIGRTPRRFDLFSCENRQVGTASGICDKPNSREPDLLEEPTQAPGQGMADPARDFVQRGVGSPRAHLRLVHSAEGEKK